MKTKSVKRLEALQRAESGLESMRRNLKEVEHREKLIKPGIDGVTTFSCAPLKEANRDHQEMIRRHIAKAERDIEQLKTVVAQDRKC